LFVADEGIEGIVGDLEQDRRGRSDVTQQTALLPEHEGYHH
jgi:hypothetical protein